MKKYKIDLAPYEVDVTSNVRDEETNLVTFKTAKEPYPMQENIYSWLRHAGVWKDGIELCDAHDLAKRFEACEDTFIELNEMELGLVKKVFNKLISQQEDPTRGIMALGGPIHEECILRVFKAPEC